MATNRANRPNQNKRDARKLADHLERAEKGLEPVKYAQRESKKYIISPHAYGSEISIDAFHVRPSPDEIDPKVIKVDMRLRVDDRRFRRRPGSFVHSIALKIDTSNIENPVVTQVAGIAGRDNSANCQGFNIPSNIAALTRPNLERDLEFMSLLLKERGSPSIPDNLRNILTHTFHEFVVQGQAAKFSSSIPAANIRHGQNRSGLAR